MSSGFHWVIPPSKELIPNVEKYGQRIRVALHAMASYWGQSIQDEARRNARWTPRSGAAVSGLFYAVDGFGLGEIKGQILDKGDPAALMKDVEVVEGKNEILIITLSHTVFYGKFLELSHGERYAIIMSTIEQNLPGLERLMKKYIERL